MILRTLLMTYLSLAVLATQATAQDYTQLSLPEGAKARLGKGVLRGTIAYSPDGTRLAVASSIGIWLYETQTYKEVALLTGHTEEATSIAFSPDGRTVASGATWRDTTTLDRQNVVILWDIVTGKRVQTFTGHKLSIERIAFSPDGQTLAGGGEGNTVRLWDVPTGASKLTLRGDGDGILGIAFSPDGHTLVVSNYVPIHNGIPQGETIRLWDAVTGARKGTFTGHTENVSSVAFSPEGRTLASGSRDATIRLWDTITGEHKTTLTGHTGSVFSVAFSPDGRTLASGSRDETIRLWDTITGEHKTTLTGHTGSVYSVAFSPDGRTLASGSRDETIRLWDAITGEHKTTLTRHTDSVYSVAFSPDGRTLASGSGDATIRLWDAVMGRHKQTLTGHMFGVGNVVFTPDGSMLASSGEWQDQTIRLWDAATGEHKQTLTGHRHEITSIAFSPDGRTLASGSVDNTIRLWDAATGEHKQTLTGHTFDVYSIVFSPDGRLLASGSYKEIGLWDVAMGEHKQTLTGHTIGVSSIAFSPDGRMLVSASGDGTALLWGLTPPMEPTLLEEDVNRDGIVNILDLVQVANEFGQTGENDADVNGDGIVNIVDLVKVAGALGNTGAAPSAQQQPLAMLTTTNVKQWLAQAQGLDLTDATLQRGIIFLERLLAALTPKETLLLPNYPNPFNPETWIPYRLTHAADVKVMIYDTKGVVVRQLDLGHQPAGYYTARTRAAYWDGHNSLGELVGSGVYFYQFSADDFSAMRKMVILK